MTLSSPNPHADYEFSALRANRSAVLPLAVLGSLLIHTALLAIVIWQLGHIEALGGGGTTLEAINVDVVSAAALEARTAQPRVEADAASSHSIAETDGHLAEVTSMAAPDADAAEVRDKEPDVERSSADRQSEPAPAETAALMEPVPDVPSSETSARPKFEEREVEPRETPQPTQPASPAQSAGGAASRGADGQTAARAQAAASPGVMRSYARAVSKALEAAKLKDNRQRRRGRVTVMFVLNTRGGLELAQLAQASGDATLDQAALNLLRRASFPEPPAGASRAELTYTVPVDFR